MLIIVFLFLTVSYSKVFCFIFTSFFMFLFFFVDIFKSFSNNLHVSSIFKCFFAPNQIPNQRWKGKVDGHRCSLFFRMFSPLLLMGHLCQEDLATLECHAVPGLPTKMTDHKTIQLSNKHTHVCITFFLKEIPQNKKSKFKAKNTHIKRKHGFAKSMKWRLYLLSLSTDT